ncbi:SnoaL-like polyketide cyclase [Legionella sainthelensi]|uniref:SnoaL-like polyketide cyclase n=1 Tax=Legionella sainthelensi TaxID=28087 RepID=A0A0W0YHB7_9GAMM|nr:ester cyclase [Legionella sainthelensi]KTD56272.1 SnoaL-like polyketide cyclase [Legionella sainthelensi]VEH31998.1 Predicted ester cyclase [Legionella sainthelensi]
MLIKSYLAIITTLLFILSTDSYAHNKPHTNREIATAFFEAIVNKKDFNLASEYIGTVYIEHDPEGKDGSDGLKHYIEYLQNNFPKSHVTIKRVIADGDYVFFHVHSILVPGTLGDAIVDLFRLENGKVVEHWDVTQAIPVNSANSNGMF